MICDKCEGKGMVISIKESVNLKRKITTYEICKKCQGEGAIKIKNAS